MDEYSSFDDSKRQTINPMQDAINKATEPLLKVAIKEFGEPISLSFRLYNQIRFYEQSGKLGINFSVAGKKTLAEQFGVTVKQIDSAFNNLTNIKMLGKWVDHEKPIYRKVTRTWVSNVRLAELKQNSYDIRVGKKNSYHIREELLSHKSGQHLSDPYRKVNKESKKLYSYNSNELYSYNSLDQQNVGLVDDTENTTQTQTQDSTPLNAETDWDYQPTPNLNGSQINSKPLHDAFDTEPTTTPTSTTNMPHRGSQSLTEPIYEPVDDDGMPIKLKKAKKTTQGNKEINGLMALFENHLGVKLPRAYEERRYCKHILNKLGGYEKARASIIRVLSRQGEEYYPTVSSPRDFYEKLPKLILAERKDKKPTGYVDIDKIVEEDSNGR